MEIAKQVFRALHGGHRPLKIGSVELDAYVLENKKRVLSGLGLQRALNLTEKRGSEIARLVGSDWLKPFIDQDLAIGVSSPILFVRPGKGGIVAHGYEATILPKLCRAINAARRNGRVKERQAAIAAQAEILGEALMDVGIIALVDEVTGYQETREEAALQKILDIIILEKAETWHLRFHKRLFREILRVWDLDWPEDVNTPSFVGGVINKYIYDKLPPGVAAELRKRTSRDEDGRPTHRYHQLLTDTGVSLLEKQISRVEALLLASRTKWEFQRLFAQAFPETGNPVEMLLEIDGPRRGERVPV